MPKFTHLHVHSHYSLLDGLPKIDELLDYVKELGMDSVALTDHGVMYGAVEFYKKAKAKGIKPIIGCEVYTAFEKMTDKRPNVDAKRNHLILLAKNEKGYKNLVRLVTKAHLDGFYYKPRIDDELLEKHAEGLIGLSACLQGKIPRLLLSNRNEEAEDLAKKYESIFGKGNFYLELQPHAKIPDQITANKKLIELSKKTGIPLVATNDIHYLKHDDAEAQDILMLINTGSDPNDPERLSMTQDDFSMKSPEEMAEFFKEAPEAIENTQKIADECNFNFELGKTKLPVFPLPEDKTAEQFLEELCKKGLKTRFGENPDAKITERLKYELLVIEKTGFAGYFLIVQDFVNWAKQNRIIVGPGRGSAGGSLVAYLTNITNVDPLKHDLLFERFLNPERISMPDIDLDFADRRRDEVIKYVSEKYGQDRVAQIITFGTMAARAVVRDVGRALQYTYSYCDQLAKMIPMGMDLAEVLEKVDEFKEKYETDEQAKKLIDLAKKLEGVARHASTHACGVVISADPLTESVPLQRSTQSEEGIITQYEMHSIEDLGLLKMDFLGLKNLTIIEDTLARIYVLHNQLKIDLDNIPYDDQKTYKLLQDALTTSVFQLESDGMKRYLKELHPTTFEDITAMVALYRPGPMQFIPDYIARKHSRQKIEYLHPKLEPILKETQGICIYQEQLMKIAQEVCGFTLGEADVLRKAIGKKIKGLLDAQETKFVERAIKNGASKKVAEELWQWILPFASYGFNKSHSAAYATIAYQTAYLKAHFPVEFMASVLTSERADVERIAFLIDECKKMDVEVLPPNINESLKNFTVVEGKKQIRFGLLAIKNVGVNIIDAVVEEKKANGAFKSIGDFIHRVKSKDLNKKSMEALIKAGAFDQFAERNQLLQNLEKMLEIARENNKNQNTNQMGLFANTNVEINRDIKLEPSPAATNFEKLNWEKELLGLYVSSHPLNDFKKLFEARTTPILKIDGAYVNKKIIVGGLISSVKKIITKNGKPMLFIKLEDLTGKTEVVIFPNLLERNPVALQENKIVFVAGRVDDRNGEIKIVADDVQEILVPRES
ncbi:MAG: DNA polymerase III subunit alpha [Candidatus Staskawiczbacteria bacterium RIFCSPLOWO2_01_FULL_37_25b]|uniref:DNA polymerase III subunit alpha n=1 Tax=Candidatus Staskawiczbacteria bacterium RIFCSPLOWO2_01_FULL_37_25b TaxID=1802213 RepID=A0A1G2IEB0_9BACT|nr:MAG: DNA polymerase III subunit alpha [Candidatus Staskawiczbacteria bacterium RIFCSPLOWO2_01_FULL_37_25b]